MAASDILDTIENNVEVENFKDRSGRRLWPLLRQKIVFQEVKKSLGLDNRLRTRNKKQLATNFFYGIHQFFGLRKFDYLFFNNTDKRIPLNGVLYDIFFDAWADKLSQERSLFIEWAKEGYVPKKKVHSKNVVSDLPFKLIISVVSKFIKPSLQKKVSFHEVIEKFKLSIDINKELKTKLAELFVFKVLFKLIRPKAIFVLSSFTKVSIVMAAKELGIKVYEAQHGYIGDAHTFYSATTHFKEAYPDYLLAFGTYEKYKASKRLIFDSNQILPIGSLRLELHKKQASPKELISIRNDYTFVFCVTLQALKEDEMLTWIKKEAQAHTDWLFILRPKNNENSYKIYTEQENIVRLDGYSIYDILKISHYNITIYSTTAIEGLFLDTEPVFFNIQNLSKNHFNTEKMNAIVVEEGHMLTVDFWKKKSNSEHSFFIESYFENVKNTELHL